jgi:hypothetical protein
MSLKDVIFLVLIVLSGLIFYLHGIDCGVRRTRRLFERYLSNPNAFTELPPSEVPTGATELPTKVHIRGSRAVFPKSAVQGIFGKN